MAIFSRKSSSSIDAMDEALHAAADAAAKRADQGEDGAEHAPATDAVLAPSEDCLPSNPPRQLFIGHYAHIKRRELERYLRGYATSHCDAPRNARFQIRRFENGFLYELHDGGSAGGVLTSLIQLLETNRVVVIPTAERKMRVSRELTGITAFMLNEADASPATDGVRFKDRLRPLTRAGLGILSFGAITFVAGLTLFAAGAVINFLAIDGSQRPDYQVAEKALPTAGLNALRRQVIEDSYYVDRLDFKGGEWKVRQTQAASNEGLPPPRDDVAAATAEMAMVLNGGGAR